MRVEIPARTVDEPRWLVVGRIEGRHWSAVVTRRQEVTSALDLDQARRPGTEQRRVNVDFRYTSPGLRVRAEIRLWPAQTDKEG
jgi:hypothetical protein